jgi:pimeloyl-ACP methyl ester carboxylesterase
LRLTVFYASRRDLTGATTLRRARSHGSARRLTVVIEERELAMGSHFYDWRHGRIHYRRSGLGDPLILVHDLYGGASSEEFDHNVRALSANYRVYAIDLIGFGESDAPRMRYRADLYPLLLKEFVEDVIHSPVHAVASGASCAFLATVAAERSDLLRKLVLISPYDYSRKSVNRVWSSNLFWEALRLLFVTPPFRFIFQDVMAGEWELAEMLRRAFYDERRINPEMVKRLSELARKPRAIHVYASLETGLLFKSFKEVLTRVTIPTLFICGREVKSDFAEQLEQLAQFTRGSQVEWVNRAGTWVHHEMALKTNRLIANFLEEFQGDDNFHPQDHELIHA